MGARGQQRLDPVLAWFLVVVLGGLIAPSRARRRALCLGGGLVRSEFFFRRLVPLAATWKGAADQKGQSAAASTATG